MQWSLPIVSTFEDAIPEIVDDSCGLLVEPQDVDGLVAALLTFRDDTARWRAARAGARARAAQFDHVVWARKFDALCAAPGAA